jgi:hypothetical protein
MAATAGRARPRWMILLRPRWLAWHAFAVLAFAGMLWLGAWQLHRAESGNELSWAYTFEWPLFAICGGYFWVRSLREELQEHKSAEAAGATGAEAPEAGVNAASSGPDADASARKDAYLARLQAEVRGHGKWHGWR